jgi:hypothetical protein
LVVIPRPKRANRCLLGPCFEHRWDFSDSFSIEFSEVRPINRNAAKHGDHNGSNGGDNGGNYSAHQPPNARRHRGRCMIPYVSNCVGARLRTYGFLQNRLGIRAMAGSPRPGSLRPSAYVLISFWRVSPFHRTTILPLAVRSLTPLYVYGLFRHPARIVVHGVRRTPLIGHTSGFDDRRASDVTRLLT